MPNTSSAKKALRQNITARSRNRHFSALYKETLKELEITIKGGDAKKAAKLLPDAYSRIDTLVKKNIIHLNNAARKKSALAKRVRAMAGSEKPASKAEKVATKPVAKATAKPAAKTTKTAAKPKVATKAKASPKTTKASK